MDIFIQISIIFAALPNNQATPAITHPKDVSGTQKGISLSPPTESTEITRTRGALPKSNISSDELLASGQTSLCATPSLYSSLRLD